MRRFWKTSLALISFLSSIAGVLAWFNVSPNQTLPYAIAVTIVSLLLLTILFWTDRRQLQGRVANLERQILEPNSDDFMILEHTVFSTEFEHQHLQKADSRFYIVGITHTRLCPPETQSLLFKKHQSGCDVRLVFQDYDSPQDVLERVGSNSRTYHDIYAALPIAEFRANIRDGFKRFSELERMLRPDVDLFRLTSCYPIVPMIVVDDDIYTVPRFIARLFCDVEENFNFDGISANGVSIRATTWLGRILVRHFTMLWEHPKLARRIRPTETDRGDRHP